MRVAMVVVGGVLFAAWAVAATLPPPTRLHSPSGRYDILFQPLSDDWTHVRKAQANVAREAMEQYAIALCVKGSTEPLTVVYFADTGPRALPEDIGLSMQWSTDESFMVFPDRPHALLNGHVLQRVASLTVQKVWSLEADHVHWIDDHRFVGDLNNQQIAGGVLIFDGKLGTSELLLAPEREVGYQLTGVEGRRALIREILVPHPQTKTTWDKFTPACFDLDLDSLKKHSLPCPAS